jgi:hypothetical protein
MCAGFVCSRTRAVGRFDEGIGCYLCKLRCLGANGRQQAQRAGGGRRVAQGNLHGWPLAWRAGTWALSIRRSLFGWKNSMLVYEV